MIEPVTDLNDIRRIKNIEKQLKIYEKQLADLKKATTVLEGHREYLFFSITCSAMFEEQKKIATELIRLRVRLDRAKNKEY